jgi:hypothetical protein
VDGAGAAAGENHCGGSAGAARNLDHLTRAVKRRLKMIQYQSRLVDGCLTQTKLTMDTA